MPKFLEKLQNSDETTKRRWMFVLSGASMVIVVFVWLAYFNSLVSGFTTPEAAKATEAKPAEVKSFPFFATAKNGLAAMYGAFWNLLRDFGEILSEPREYIISPPTN